MACAHGRRGLGRADRLVGMVGVAKAEAAGRQNLWGSQGIPYILYPYIYIYIYYIYYIYILYLYIYIYILYIYILYLYIVLYGYKGQYHHHS